MNAGHHVTDLIEMYALDALPAGERVAVEEHLAGCARCRELAAEAAQTVVQLSYGTEEVAPSLELRRRLMARIETDLAGANVTAVTGQPSSQGPAPAAGAALPQSALRGVAIPSRQGPPQVRPQSPKQGLPGVGIWAQFWRTLSAWSPVLAVASAILLVAVGVYALSLRSEIARTRTALAVLNDPNLRTVELPPTGVGPTGARARLLLAPDQSVAVLNLSGLKPLDASQTYEFWLIKDGKPLPAGLLRADAAGNAQFLVQAAQPLGTFQQAGLTIEPAGGSQTPTTTAMIFAGTVQE